MAARSSSSSDHAPISIEEKLDALALSKDGPSEVIRVGDGRTREAERQLSNSKKEKGEAIIREAGDINEVVSGRVGTSENLEAVEMGRAGTTAGIEECGCCYEYISENMVQCRDGHRFCFECIEKQVNEILYGGVKAHGSLSCFAINEECKESIPLSQIMKAIPDVLERYEYRQAQDAIVEAKIENLVYCPFCNIPYEIDKCVQVLDCPNPKCLKASCIQCKKPSHLPLRCEEVEKKSAETAHRREVEERMTKAVTRECNNCGVKLIKEYGCNRLRCRCGETMCYVCRHKISYMDFISHFCDCRQHSGERGKPCKICKKCSYIETEIEDNEALGAKEEALKEFVDRNPELIDLEIGPPLTMQTGHGQELYVQGFPPYGIRHPPEFNVHSAQLANLVVPPPIAPPQFLHPTLPPHDFFRFGNGGQFPNMGAPAPLPPPHFLIYGNGGQIVNGAAAASLPPAHSFRYGNGGELADMAVTAWLHQPPFFRYGGEPANMAVPPQHFFRYGNGGQLANMGVPAPSPPQHFFRYGNGGQPANMNLPDQQDYGRHLQHR